jgi:hypothetical protein
VPFKVLHLQERLGIPTVRLETTFHSTVELGDFLEFELDDVAFAPIIFGTVRQIVSKQMRNWVDNDNIYRMRDLKLDRKVADIQCHLFSRET